MSFEYKMTTAEFLAKLDSEGMDYALNEYGLSHKQLNETADPEFYEVVKNYVEALREIEPLRYALEEYMESYDAGDYEED